MKHLNAADREALALKLATMKRWVLDELREESADVAGTAEDRVHDAEAADDARMDEVRFAEIEVDRTRLQDIESALQRIAEGRYGVCIDCDADIPRDRLLAQPTAIRCAGCQSEHELKRAPR
ncbi:MAG: TraR/DksA family transcriptional regulator [Gammaproteobacteria bacterium]|nr:TraR/DksA family transcriptional regulator [Gammaproteobacteria bacterium]MBU1439861.1 TraR/DksA family transcriptional regulator [Gammaproteobacteria bacterium]MBU2286232.1 TraR/DksA family transcriptional regulator [Gammaproteobacteria bacterium]MBU2408435.1 TraR/DksA family transcriptional regulator [Gammaproteobacteria bacterium]